MGARCPVGIVAIRVSSGDSSCRILNNLYWLIVASYVPTTKVASSELALITVEERACMHVIPPAVLLSGLVSSILFFTVSKVFVFQMHSLPSTETLTRYSEVSLKNISRTYTGTEWYSSLSPMLQVLFTGAEICTSGLVTYSRMLPLASSASAKYTAAYAWISTTKQASLRRKAL